MAKLKLEKEIEDWLENLEDEFQECFFELQEITDDTIVFLLERKRINFLSHIPKIILQTKKTDSL